MEKLKNIVTINAEKINLTDEEAKKILSFMTRHLNYYVDNIRESDRRYLKEEEAWFKIEDLVADGLISIDLKELAKRKTAEDFSSVVYEFRTTISCFDKNKQLKNNTSNCI